MNKLSLFNLPHLYKAKAFIWFFMAFAIIFFSTLNFSSLSAQSTQDSYIKSISILGNNRIEQRTIISYLAINQGQIASQQLIDKSIKQLFNTGLFSDVSIAIQKNTLIVQVKENPIVNRVIFNGNKNLKTDKFTDEIQLSSRQVYTQAKLRADLQRILDLYKTAGRFAVKITPKAKTLSQNRVDIVFDIKEGPLSKISAINFVGNIHFKDKDLQKIILTHPKRWWKIFSKFDNFDSQRIEYDQELLRQYYLKKGYADFQVASAVSELSPNRRDFFVTFTLSEGNQYIVDRIKVSSNTEKINSKFLRSLISLKKGDVYNYEIIEEAIEAMTYTSGAAGYAFVDINPEIIPNPSSKTIDIDFKIDEGPRVYVDRINIKGNSSTLDYVVRREMRLAEGDAFNRVIVDRSKQRLRALDYFDEIEISETPSENPEKINLDINLKEKPTGSFNFSLGFSSLDAILGSIQYSERNFLGRGQNINVTLQSGYNTKQFNFSFNEPYFLDRNLSAGFSFFANDINYSRSAIKQKSLGSVFSLGFASSEYSALSASYSLTQENSEYNIVSKKTVLADAALSSVVVNQKDNVSVVSLDSKGKPLVNSKGTKIKTVTSNFCNFLVSAFNPSCLTRGKRLKSELSLRYNYDHRDDVLRPTKGLRSSASISYAGLGGDVEYLKTELSAAYYQPLGAGFVGALKVNAGNISSNKLGNIRITDRFFKGSTSFRGFDIAGIGPRYLTANNKRGQSLGGNNFAIGSLEFLVPLPLPKEYGLRTVLFYEFGSVWGVDSITKTLNNNMDNWFDYDGDGIVDPPIRDKSFFRSSAGISVGWKSPLGLLRLDYAVPLEYTDYDQKKNFRISGGINF